MTDQITEEDFAAWKHHPITKRVYELIEQHLEEFDREWLANTLYSDLSGVQIEVLKIEYVSKRDAYTQILNLKAESLHKEEIEPNDESEEYVGD